MPWTDDVRNTQADEDAARIATVSAHTGDPGSTGAAEASGGSYARVAPSFEAAGSEGPLGAEQPATVGVAWGEASFELPAGTFTHYGAWSSGGVFLGGFEFPSPIQMVAAGTQQVSVYTASQV